MLSKRILSFFKIEQTWLLDILVFSLCLGCFYFYHLGHYPLFTPDEGRYSEVAREMLISKNFVTPHLNGVPFLDKPIFHYWLQTFAFSLFGLNEWAARFFPALFGILGCISIYITGRVLFDRRTGIIAAILLATTPLYFGGSHYANMDVEVAFFISSSLLCFILAMQSQSWRLSLLLSCYFFAGLAFLTKGLIGIFFPILISFVWLTANRKWHSVHKLHFLLGGIVFAMTILPWYISIQKTNPDFFYYFFIVQHIKRFLSAAEFNNKSPPWFYLPILIGGFFPWVIFLFQTAYQNFKNFLQQKEKSKSEIFFLIWAVIIILFFSLPRSKLIGYIFPALPPMALLIGNYLSNIWKNPLRTTTQIASVIFILLSITYGTLCFYTINHRWLDLSNTFIPFLKTIGLIYIVAGLVTVILFKYITLPRLFYFYCFLNILILLTLLTGANDLNQNSTKSLVHVIQGAIKPNDEIAAYYKYYPDATFYLHRNIIVGYDWQNNKIIHHDNWARELWSGMQFKTAQSWLISEKAFWHYWHHNKRLFVFINSNYLSQFAAQTDHFYILGQQKDIFLISNQKN